MLILTRRLGETIFIGDDVRACAKSQFPENLRDQPLYQQCCSLDLEGIVAKPKISPYREVKGQTTWIKVKNPDYSQAEGRQELFNKRR